MNHLRGKGGGRQTRQARPAYLPSLAVLVVTIALGAWAPLPEQVMPDLSAYPWLYLRDGQALATGEGVVEVIAVGDVMLGRGVANAVEPLSSVAPWLHSADLVLGNLECIIA
jgi:hypothetical protein